jgi:hypothetical protein
MSYLLIGNISALICDDCIEPLANARIRVYLPDNSVTAGKQALANGLLHDPQPLSAKEVLMKADRLLAETTLDEHGNFNLAWEEIHLFTEALDLDLCLDLMPGKNGTIQSRNYHLSNMVLPWKRSKNGYLSAYAYVIPSETWNTICGNAGAWVITGVVKPHRPLPGHKRLKVEAYNALSGKMIGQTYTNEFGRYTLHFCRKDLYSGSMMVLKNGRRNMGPDVYFKIYRHDQLIWEETETDAGRPERQDLSPCSCVNIDYRPSVVKKATDQINSWLNNMITIAGAGRRKRERYRFIPQQPLIRHLPYV